MKYLGYTLKPMGYKTGDWTWILDRFYNRISGWESRLLTLAGRLTLIQAVLAQLAIYWAHLFYLPAKIINKMKAYAANFLWGGKTFQSKIHLVKLDSIMRPKKAGGWGILDMRKMGNALLSKSFIRGIYGKGPWSVFINRKYLKGKGIEYWYRRNSLGIKRGSAICLSFRKNKSFLLRNFRWSLHSGANIFLGNDLIQNGLPSLPHPVLIDFLHTRGIFTWDRLIRSWVNLTPVWKEAADLSLPSQISTIWASTRLALQGMAFKRSEHKDALLWSLPHAPSPVRVKDIYASLSISPVSPVEPLFPPSLWKAAYPVKMVLFAWLLYWNRNLTWEVLQNKGWQGPGQCAFCKAAEETNLHMFFKCQVTLQLWYDLALLLDFPHTVFNSVQEGIAWWSTQSVSRRTLFLIACWNIWTWRNDSIFSSKRKPVASILLGVTSLMDALGI